MGDRLHAVTGAFGYSGRAITRRLLAAGDRVRNLTGHPGRSPLPTNGMEEAVFRFDDPAALRASLEGVHTLFNTYWIRFPHGGTNHAVAVRNSRALFEAARAAGVQRVVHTSITNPSLGSPLTYFRGKAEVEEALRSTGLSHSILRPAVFFGERDVLVNNIAWAVRRLPVFGIPAGEYGLAPIHVDDFARLAQEQSASTGNATIDAVGPETFSYRELVRSIARSVGTATLVVAVPRGAVHLAARLLGLVTGDVVLTREEVDGLASNLLVSSHPPLGTTRLSDWLAAEASTLGRRWASELDRHYRR